MLKKGEVLAFKTDTVWGFGCEVDDIEAVNKIYEIKKRDAKKPLILMSDDFSNLKKCIKFIPSYAQELIEKYLPGALTLIFEKSDLCPDFITSNGSTVGLRVPNSDEFKKAVLKSKNKVLATTSCNIAGEEPVKNYQEACELFSSIATVIKPIDDKENENLPSTVVLCLEDGYKILRQGALEL
ncbi:MAG: threonylcarbamoyl-AMP synthase [Candidatus Gastranaerophilales bacterium]|nr:threonylcarbamoyl-AMP synthase [Candidatus Gastranaerophilales bacterium]